MRESGTYSALIKLIEETEEKEVEENNVIFNYTKGLKIVENLRKNLEEEIIENEREMESLGRELNNFKV